MTKINSAKRKKHLIITLIISIIVVGTLVILMKGLTLNPSMVASTQIGKPATDFEVPILQGASWLPSSPDNKIRLSSLRGKTVILNFWASWCVSCREEAMFLEAFWKRYQDKGVIVLGVAIQDTPESALEFAKLHGKTYPLAIDDSGKTTIDYGVYGVPETFIIDSNGTIVHKEAGPVTTQLLESLSSKYLASPSDRG